MSEHTNPWVALALSAATGNQIDKQMAEGACVDPTLVLGDVDGHPFRGNQYKAAEAAGRDADDKSTRAWGYASKGHDERGRNLTGRQIKKAHEDAIKANAKAAKLYEGAGNVGKARYHRTEADDHASTITGGDISDHGEYAKKYKLKLSGDDLVLGDVAGHEFHGNQYTAAVGASKESWEASKKARLEAADRGNHPRATAEQKAYTAKSRAAHKATTEAHKMLSEENVRTQSGRVQDALNYAESKHREAASGNPDSFMEELHTTAADKAKEASVAVWNAAHPPKAGAAREEHEERYKRLTEAGHKVAHMKDDPDALRGYEGVVKSNAAEAAKNPPKPALEQQAERKKDIEYERDHGKMRTKAEDEDHERRQFNITRAKSGGLHAHELSRDDLLDAEGHLTLAGNPYHAEDGKFTSGGSDAKKGGGAEEGYQQQADRAHKATKHAENMSRGATGSIPDTHKDAADAITAAANEHRKAIDAAGKIAGGALGALSHHREAINNLEVEAKGHMREYHTRSANKAASEGDRPKMREHQRAAALLGHNYGKRGGGGALGPAPRGDANRAAGRDVNLSHDLELGDVAGHEFHGNQYSKEAQSASKAADDYSKRIGGPATRKGDHAKAADLYQDAELKHRKAAVEHELFGDKDKSKWHHQQASESRKWSAAHRKSVK